MRKSGCRRKRGEYRGRRDRSIGEKDRDKKKDD